MLPILSPSLSNPRRVLSILRVLARTLVKSFPFKVLGLVIAGDLNFVLLLWVNLVQFLHQEARLSRLPLEKFLLRELRLDGRILYGHHHHRVPSLARLVMRGLPHFFQPCLLNKLHEALLGGLNFILSRDYLLHELSDH